MRRSTTSPASPLFPGPDPRGGKETFSPTGHGLGFPAKAFQAQASNPGLPYRWFPYSIQPSLPRRPSPRFLRRAFDSIGEPIVETGRDGIQVDVDIDRAGNRNARSRSGDRVSYFDGASDRHRQGIDQRTGNRENDERLRQYLTLDTLAFSLDATYLMVR